MQHYREKLESLEAQEVFVFLWSFAKLGITDADLFSMAVPLVVKRSASVPGSHFLIQYKLCEESLLTELSLLSS